MLNQRQRRLSTNENLNWLQEDLQEGVYNNWPGVEHFVTATSTSMHFRTDMINDHDNEYELTNPTLCTLFPRPMSIGSSKFLCQPTIIMNVLGGVDTLILKIQWNKKELFNSFFEAAFGLLL
jgi:hypothetical protein